MVADWKVFSGEWKPRKELKVWLADSAAVEWQKLRVALCEAPVVLVAGAKKDVSGLYDFVPTLGSPGTPPVFQHQQNSSLWLYLAKDQRWWIGNKGDMKAICDHGFVSSGAVQPGTHPNKANRWKMISDNEEIEMEVRGVDAARAAERWANARLQADTWSRIQMWGVTHDFGEYEYDCDLSGPTQPPVYKYNNVMYPGMWLYVATDGAWWLGTELNKDERRPAGFLRSDPVEPGTLPADVETWFEDRAGADRAGTWKVARKVRVFIAEEVENIWSCAHRAAAESPVIVLEGVHGQDLAGLFDFWEPDASRNDEGEVYLPVYRHQIQQDLWLYVATDGCWWAGTTDIMETRAPKGKMCSGPILPGTLPTAASGWQVWNSTTKKMQYQDSVKFS
jgi:hypothetical protein